MSTNQPFVSVVTPCYNGADFIVECAESVLKQTHQNFEYILVNNCSKDNTLQLAHELARKDSRIRVHDNVDFLDVMTNHNHALRLISPESKYVKCVSVDDWIFPDCLHQMVEFAEQHPSVGVVGHYSLEGSRVLFEGLEYERPVVNGREICRDTLLGKMPYVFGAPTTLLYRADLVRAVKDFFPYAKGNPHADMAAVYQALQHSDFGFVHQVLSYTRIHAASETSSSFKFGRINRALLANLVHFGPIYLSPEELEGQTAVMLDKYYSWLVPALWENGLDQKFIEMQRTGLRSLGFELSTPKVVKAALMRGLELAENPSVTTRKISAMLKRRGKVVARGTNLT